MSARKTTVASDPGEPQSFASRRGIALILAGAFVIGIFAFALATAGTNRAVDNLLQNPSLEDGTDSALTCWAFGGFGTNEFSWKRISGGHSGTYAEQLDVTGWVSGDRKLVTTQDAGVCAPSVTAGRVFTATAWYRATRPPVLFAYYRDSGGSWVYWTQSPELSISAVWTQASFTTPTLPGGATNVSIGLGLTGVGSVTMDDFELLAEN